MKTWVFGEGSIKVVVIRLINKPKEFSLAVKRLALGGLKLTKYQFPSD